MSKRNYDDLSRDELIRLLQSRDRRDATRFGLVWEASEIERDRALNADFVALDLDPSLSCPNPADPSTPFQNLIIEGDNFDALRYLKMTYAGRVKCIYIDPPYNTGNKDFVYNDHYVDKEDLWRHSKWCEFMFQRLTLAKDLLTQDGVIFVSIDDNEIATLRLMMDRVFSPQKLIATLIWKSRQNKDNRNTNGVSNDHEYVLCYGTRLRGELRDVSQYSNPDNDPNGPWTSGNMVGLATKQQRPNLHYELVNPATGVSYECPEKGWRYGRETMTKLIADGRILWPKSKTGRPREKAFLKDLESDVTGYSSLVGAEVYTRDGSKELRDIFGGQEKFAFPKPSLLVQELIHQATAPNPDSLTLDFFAGSGTTAHAVHKLNQSDGGNRRVILVSSTEATADQPDKNLCRDVCATRVRRVIQGYNDTPGLGGDFAYLRTRRIPTSNITDIDHPQVWTALQLTHTSSLLPFTDTPILHRDHDEGRLIYIPHMTSKLLPKLRKTLADCTAATLYTWQPDLLRLRLKSSNHVQIEPVPESLARRFGIRL